MKVKIGNVTVEIGGKYRDDKIAVEMVDHRKIYTEAATYSPEDFAKHTEGYPLPEGPTIELGRIYRINGAPVEPFVVNQSKVGCMDTTPGKNLLPRMTHEEFLQAVGVSQ
ncbi:MAG: hypothetical protein ABJN62_11320 [Halioglobus sp.]